MTHWKWTLFPTFFSQLNPDQKNVKVIPAYWKHRKLSAYQNRLLLQPKKTLFVLACNKYWARITNKLFSDIPDLSQPEKAKSFSSSLWCCAALCWQQICPHFNCCLEQAQHHTHGLSIVGRNTLKKTIHCQTCKYLYLPKQNSSCWSTDLNSVYI